MDSPLALQFGENLAFMVLAAFLYGLIVHQYLRHYRKLSIFVSGLLFGGMAVVSMLFPVEPVDGVIFDGRGIVVALAGPFGGGYGALIAGAIAGAYRLLVAGPGAMAGALGIAASAMFGFAYWKFRGKSARDYRLYDFLVIGILLPAVSLPSLFILPMEVAVAILDKILVPMVIYEIIGVLVMGLFLRQELVRNSAVNDLYLSEQRFRDFTEIASDYYWEMDETGQFTYFSDQFEAVTGYPREKAIGLTRAQLWNKLGSGLFEPDRNRADIFQLVETRQPFRRVRFKLPRSYGSDIIVEISGRPYFNRWGEYKGYRGVGLDVTREVLAVREKEISRQMAEDARQEAVLADRAKTDFLARMSHELRSPLNSVIGFADVLAREPDGPLGAPIYKNYVDNIRIAGGHLQDLIGDILDLSKIESGRLELEDLSFSLRDLAQHLQSIMSDAARERNNRMRLDMNEGLPAYVTGDPTRIRQVIVNFLSNAIKFTSGGEITLCVRGLARQDDCIHLEVSVADTGIGMSAEQQEGVFDAFAQADVSVTRNFGGTGLGLSVCKRLVESMGGEIGVESERERGSRFWFRVTLPWQAEAEAEDVSAIIPAAHVTPLSLLVVDDIEVNRQLAGALLASEGHSVEVAADGAEALAILHSDAGHHIDAVLMDIHMPHMNGMDTTRMIRETFDDNRVQVPVIALTADVMQENIDQYYKAGMDGFVGKPIKMSELNATLVRIGFEPVKVDKTPRSEATGDSAAKAGDKKSNAVDLTRLSVAYDLYPDQDKGEVLETLKSQCHEFIDAAMHAHDSRKPDELRMQLHTLKGVASNIGFCELADLCRSLEQQLRKPSADTNLDLNELAPALESAVQEAASKPF